MKDKKIVETTSAGAIASVVMPMGNVQKRAGSLFKGKKTKKKFYETRSFNSKQELIQYFISRGKTAAQASAAWERGYRGTTQKKSSTKPPKEDWLTKHEREKEEREEANRKDLSEGKMKDLSHDIKNMSTKEFVDKHKRTKEYFIKILGDPDKPKNKSKKSEPVSEAEVLEGDLIIVPGMRKMKDRSFTPHKQDRRDHEVEMARSDVYAAVKDATRIYKTIKNRTEDQGLMGWQQSYITLAADYLNSVADSLEHDSKVSEMTGGVLAGGMSNFEENVAEDQINELSPETLASYKKKAGADATAADKRGDYARGNKRMRGIIKATKKQFDNDAKGVAEGMKIPSRTKMMNYVQQVVGQNKGVFLRVTCPVSLQSIYDFLIDQFDSVNPSTEFSDPRNKESSYVISKQILNIDGTKIPVAKIEYNDRNIESEDPYFYISASNIQKLKQTFNKQGLAEGLIAHADEFKVELDDDGLVHLLDGEETIRVSMPIDIWKRMAGKKGKVDEFSVEVDDGQVHVLDGEETIRVSMPIDIWKQLGKKGVAEAEIINFEESGDAKPKANVQHLLDKMLQLQNKAMMAIDRERWSELDQIKDEMEKTENKIRSSGGDKRMDAFYKNVGNKNPMDVLDPDDTKTSVKENRWRNRLWSPYWSPSNQERKDQSAVDSETRSARRREQSAGLEDEDNIPQRSNTFIYYIKIDGKILKNKSGELFKFNSTAAANKAINTMQSRPWNKDKTFTVTQNPNDDTGTIKESGHQDDQKEREENLRYSRSRADVAGDVRKNIDPNKKEENCPKCGGDMVSEELMNEKKDACYYKVKSRYKVWPSAYASGALVKCRKAGASNWGNKSKNES
jgi:hypothetical protein